MYGKSNSLNCEKEIKLNGKSYYYFDLQDAQKKLGVDLSRLPFSMKILFENLIRYENGRSVKLEDIKEIANWLKTKKSEHEISYSPARVLMQDFTGVPAVVDLAAMRDAMKKLGGDVKKINPLSAVDLVIDHSVQVDKYATNKAFDENVSLEMERNAERYKFLRWGQKAFNNFRVVPPGTGICHQVNLEYLSQVVWTQEVNGKNYAYPDTLVGTDSHTTMVNGLGVLGWGVGGIEAEAVMLGQPMSMIIPEVIGFKLLGNLKEGVTATDLVLTVTNMLRAKGVVNKFVEFYGPGLANLSLADRATIANMAPEYGATCGFFPVDNETIKYLELTSRDKDRIELVKEYSKRQGLWRDNNTPDPIFTDSMELDISSVKPSLAGPKRPQDKVLLENVKDSFAKELENYDSKTKKFERHALVENQSYKLGNGDVVIAAITSCTNTSNPSVMIAAGLVAEKAHKLGLKVKPWVKTSLAPGSKVVSEYLERANLQTALDQIGFNLVGYGCTTCIGNSGPLKPEIEKSISSNEVIVASVLSGNRNFEGRVHPLCKANYLASPPLVVAYALAGTVNIDLSKDSIGKDSNGNDVFLKDIWPKNSEINEKMDKTITPELFSSKYNDVFKGDASWQNFASGDSLIYDWDEVSTYIANPPYFENMSRELNDIKPISGAHILALFGDSITTDHISPAGNIAKNGPAANYLTTHGVEQKDFNSYGSRRGHHEVMMRGTFANIRIKNQMVKGVEGGVTIHIPSGEQMSIYDAAMKYKQNSQPLVIFAGKEYGTGSSRDWAAKGTILLGVRAVIAESFERIHRSNLVRMGVIPMEFTDNMKWSDFNLNGSELVSIAGIDANMKPRQNFNCTIKFANGEEKTVVLKSRIDTVDELEYYRHGGILQYVIRELLK